jgi:hypothetical protein
MIGEEVFTQQQNNCFKETEQRKLRYRGKDGDRG